MEIFLTLRLGLDQVFNMKTKTTFIKHNKQNSRKWYIVDATGVRLGKLASTVTKMLQGKNKPNYAPNYDTGDYVIIINSPMIDVHQRKLKNKLYIHHTGYPGGLKSKTLKDMLQSEPNNVIKKAVWGMMPKNKLGREMMKKLFIYKDGNHKHKAQKPKLFKIK